MHSGVTHDLEGTIIFERSDGNLILINRMKKMWENKNRLSVSHIHIPFNINISKVVIFGMI